MFPSTLRELPFGERQRYESSSYPLRAAHRKSIVGCAGFSRYREIECRETGTRVVPQRYITPLSLIARDKGVFLITNIQMEE